MCESIPPAASDESRETEPASSNRICCQDLNTLHPVIIIQIILSLFVAFTLFAGGSLSSRGAQALVVRNPIETRGPLSAWR